MAHLYINSRGQEVTRHSYSSGSIFKFCSQRYKLSRIDGWKEKSKYARTLFGIAIEEAIQGYHMSGCALDFALQVFDYGPPAPSSATAEEKIQLRAKGWQAHKDNGELKYSATEGDWATLRRTGCEMLALYHLRLPLFPITTETPPRFQVNLKKEIYPNSRLSGIEIVAFLDMIAPAKDTLSGKRIWDIKCMATPLNMTPGILRLDEQLKVYSWLADEPNVGFLWFQKCGRGMEKGTHVYVLEDVYVPAGGNAWVARVDEAKSEFDDEGVWIVDSEEKLKVMDEAQGRKNGKLDQTNAAKERKEAWLHANAFFVKAHQLTKQRVNFATATMTLSDRQEAADVIGNDIIRIVAANEKNFWPKEGGLRFPNDRCTRCEMRGICLNNHELRDALVERADDTFETHEDDGE